MAAASAGGGMSVADAAASGASVEAEDEIEGPSFTCDCLTTGNPLITVLEDVG
jgi:hypothetical protein